MLIEECFEYNQHFVAMMNIINLAKIQNVEGKFERHHIIPVCFYKVKGLEIDNSPENLVNLTYEQHKKVHELAVLCAQEIVMPQLRTAAHFMESYVAQSRLGGHLSEETKAKIGAAMSVALKGKKRGPMSEEQKAKISASVSATLKGHEVSAETRAKQSEAKKGDKNPSKRPEVRAKKSAAFKDRHWHLENGKRVWTE